MSAARTDVADFLLDFRRWESATHKPEFDGEWVRLGDVCAKGKSNLRQKDLKNDGPYPVYGAPGIVGFSSNYQNADAYVAVVKDGAGVGRVMACEPRSSVLGTMQALLPGKGIDRDYLLHLVRSMDLGKGFTGSTIPHIYFKDYGKTLVRALSREQQVEVANRLSGIDHLISQGKGQLSFLDDLVKSQFVEMFGDKERWASEGWPIAAVSDLICKPKSGEWGEEDLCGKSIKVLRTANFTDAGVINYTNVVTRDIDCSKLKSKSLCTGDILIEKSGGSDKKPVGRVVLFLNQNDTYLNNNFTAALRVKDPSKISYRYLFQSLYMNYWRGGTRPFESKTTGLHNLKLDGYLSKTRIPIPSIEIQQQFADFVARVDKLGFDCCREIVCCGVLFSSMSASLLCT